MHASWNRRYHLPVPPSSSGPLISQPLEALNFPLDSPPLLDEGVLQRAHLIDMLHQRGLHVV